MQLGECRLCEILEGNGREVFDVPFDEDENYAAIVSVGAFIEGWTLVVPREHLFSMRTYYDSANLWKFVKRVAERIQSTYGTKVICFEHGANCCDSETSCGTHHAHLHLVPFEKSLLEQILNDRSWEKVLASDVSGIVGDKEYLLYSDLDWINSSTEVYIHILEKAESQYFRRMLADIVGVKDYSYKTSPFIEQTKKSFEDLKGQDDGH